jgi:1-acyl-sn-glycerol-3-phosphate acyltransferase
MVSGLFRSGRPSIRNETTSDYRYYESMAELITSRRNKLFESAFSLYNTRILKKHFHALFVSGDELFGRRDPALPTVIYANHSNWWDGQIMFHLSREVWKRDAHLMMDLEQMRKYRFFRMIGVFSVDRSSPRGAMASIGHAAALLRGTGRVLWIFPQGILTANDKRPIVFESGIGRILRLAGDANILCLAFRYEFLNEQRPDVFIRFGGLEVHRPFSEDPKAFSRRARDIMEQAADSLRDDVVERRLDGFRPLLRGRASRNATIDTFHAARGRA